MSDRQAGPGTGNTPSWDVPIGKITSALLFPIFHWSLLGAVRMCVIFNLIYLILTSLKNYLEDLT